VFERFRDTPQHIPVVLLLIDGGAGVLLLVGLWTPIAGAVIAGCELWILASGGGELYIHLLLATLGATVAMIGPGARSIDSLLFGRKIRLLSR
jgi:putative oxidoreductase